MGEGYKKQTDFYNMIKEWTVSDYCTPGIKAEVILDMLISDFIEELIQNHYLKTERRNYRVTLLAKEFPISTSAENLRNAKVDYLVYVNDAEEAKLVLVELKSTNDSFNSKQMNRMEEATTGKDKDEELIAFYNRIYDKLVINKKGNSSDRIKYQYSYDHFPENWKKDGKLDLTQDTGRPNIKTDYLYIFLTDNKEKLNMEGLTEEKRLILADYCENVEEFNDLLKKKSAERVELWKFVSDILKACNREMERGAK